MSIFNTFATLPYEVAFTQAAGALLLRVEALHLHVEALLLHVEVRGVIFDDCLLKNSTV